MKAINKKEQLRELTAFTVFYYLLPITLLSLGWLRFEYRHVIIFLLGVILIAYAIDKGIKPSDLGLRTDNLRQSLVLNLFFSLSALTLVFVCYKLDLLHTNSYDGSWLFYIYYILISAPLQEYIFRSLMFYELGIFFNSKLVKIILSALLFAFAHAMYHSWQVLGVTLVMGLALGWVYLKRPNFWGVALSHIIVGLVSIFLGVV